MLPSASRPQPLPASIPSGCDLEGSDWDAGDSTLEEGIREAFIDGGADEDAGMPVVVPDLAVGYPFDDGQVVGALAQQGVVDIGIGFVGDHDEGQVGTSPGEFQEMQGALVVWLGRAQSRGWYCGCCGRARILGHSVRHPPDCG